MSLSALELVTILIPRTILRCGSCVIDTFYRKLKPRSAHSQLSGKLVGMGAEILAPTLNHLTSLLLCILEKRLDPGQVGQGIEYKVKKMKRELTSYIQLGAIEVFRHCKIV